jgi:hypothetical protein
MKVFSATAVLVVVALLGYASSGTSAQAEATQAGITSGEKVMLAFDPDRSGTSCTVIAVRGDFVGCKAETQDAGFGRTSYDRWYNLRLIVRIERPAKRE